MMDLVLLNMKEFDNYLTHIIDLQSKKIKLEFPFFL